MVKNTDLQEAQAIRDELYRYGATLIEETPEFLPVFNDVFYNEITKFIGDLADEEDTKGYTIPRGVGGVSGPIIPGTDVTPDSADQAAQWAIDILNGELNNKRPLGEGFQTKYQIEQTYMDKAKGFPVTRTVDVDAEEYLIDKGYKFIYFPYMPGEVARDIAPSLRIILKIKCQA